MLKRPAFRHLAIACSVLLAISGQAGAAPDSLDQCVDCHGETGVSHEDDIPTISGMSDIYLADNLMFYRDRERACVKTKYRSGDTTRPSISMCEIADQLSEAQMQELAVHYSSHPYVLAKQPFDAVKAARGKIIHDKDCEHCHEDAGTSPTDDAGMLAGQWMGYLRHSFDEYMTRKRPMIEKMEVKFEKLSAEDVENLVHFYASHQ